MALKNKKLLILLVTAMLLALPFSLHSYAWGDDDGSWFGYNLYWPVPGHNELSQGYHSGNAIDISDDHIEGAEIIAARGGFVSFVFDCDKFHPNDTNCSCFGFGNGIVIQGVDGKTYQYAHMLADSIPEWIVPGMYIPRGTVIGKVGTTGSSTGPHLHFGISNSIYYWEEGPDPSALEYDHIRDIGVPLDLGEEFYARVVCSTTNKTLTVEDTKITLNDNDYAGDQRWRFMRLEDGSYHIYIYYSDYVFTLMDTDDSTSLITVAPHIHSPEQSWYIYGNDGSYSLVSAQCGRVVTVGGINNDLLHMYNGETELGYQSFDIQIHKYVVESKEPTDFADGYNKYTCNCGDSYTDVLPKFNNFDDIKPDKWYTDGVLYCYKQGYMAGTSESAFGYKDIMDRQMFATILAKIDEADLSSYSKMSFSDVAAGKWYSSAVEWAYQNGYASGMGTDEAGKPFYGRKNPVTREQLALFFYTYSEKKGYDISGRADLSGFEDLDRLHSWANDAVSWAVDAGLISGTSDTTLAPRDSATRATVALIIKNYVETVANA